MSGTKYLVSIDPGMSTGVTVGTYSGTEPYRLEHAFQIEGGVEGFLEAVQTGFDPGPDYEYSSICGVEIGEAIVVAEKFTARGGGNDFSYRTNALEPLRIEGAILALGLEPSWQYPQNMYFMVPSRFKGNKKSLAHKWLKDNGLYVSPKDVGCKDADDVRSSLLHALVYMRKIGHKPTLERYFKK